MDFLKQRKTYILLAVLAGVQLAVMYGGLEAEALNHAEELRVLLLAGVAATFKAGFNRVEKNGTGTG